MSGDPVQAASDGGLCMLCLDATGDDCAVMIWRDGVGAVTERREPMPRGGGAELAVDIIERTVSESGLAWAAIDAIAVVTGPGSFTGVRIGVAAARGLALSLGVPAVGIDGFEAIATAEAERDGGQDSVAMAIVFGRAPRLVWRRYRAQGGLATPLGDAETGDPSVLSGAGGLRVVGPSAAAIDGGVVAHPDLGAVARIASRRLAATGADGLESPAPVYLRPPDATPPSLLPPDRLDHQ